MNKELAALLAATTLVAAPAAAQTALAAAQAAPAASPAITAGAAVAGPQGGPVGTIASVGADFAILKTDKHEVRLPKSAFASGSNGLVIGLSRDALNASVEQALASLNQLLTPNSPVYGAQGAALGTVETVENDLVTLKLTSGKMVRLPKSGFAPGPNGLVIGLTAEQLEAQAGAAGAD
jgi:hypothetical protein